MDMKKSKRLLMWLAAIYWLAVIGIYAVAQEQFHYTWVENDAPSALAAVGSIVYFTDRMSVTPFSGTLPGLKCFVAAVFGGIGSIPGAVVGGFVIGLCETLLVALGYSTFSDAFTFLLLIIMLLFRPTGLFGEKSTDKV